MRAMILAGGMSTRLYPLTREVPKPLVPVAGEPISGHVMRWLASHGFDEVAINIFYLAEQVEEAFGDGSRYGVKLHYLREPRLTGSAGGLKQMEGWFDGTFVVVGCDDLTTADLTALIAFHRERGALATIGLVEADEVDQYGVVILEDDGRIREFQEKPPQGTERSKLVNTGIYVFEPAIFDRIPAETFYDFGKQVFPELLADGLPFYGMKLEGAYWRDIGTPDEYRRATADVVNGRVAIPGARATGVPMGVRVPADARIDANVRIGERVVFGSGVRIGGPTVIGDDAVLEDGAVLERSIVWNRARIGERATLRDAIVGEGYTVAGDTTLIEEIVANEPVIASEP
ncbi:MAG: Nucleoside-diphosphate-sugar pyrophosphorylase [Candidatus Eremiobacteraeota bacterium]|jgi:NDP-sugar pyrophosphorylase family protein|nr:Nucleoside-diphosphate-sugar pyrophosphorylase [Candidatus Eremiobacteraeota bacterium]